MMNDGSVIIVAKNIMPSILPREWDTREKEGKRGRKRQKEEKGGGGEQ